MSMILSVAPIQTFAAVATHHETSEVAPDEVKDKKERENASKDEAGTVETTNESPTENTSSTTDTINTIENPTTPPTGESTDTENPGNGETDTPKLPETPTEVPKEEETTTVPPTIEEEVPETPETGGVETPVPDTPPAVTDPAPQPLEKADFNTYWESSQTPTGGYTTTGSIQYAKNQTTEAFIEEIGESARKIGQEQDLYASVMMAQAILESGSGSSSLSQAPHYNLFGIKGAHEGASVSYSTQEDDGSGNLSTIQASFRSYEDYEDSFNDYAELIKNGISGNSEFYSGVWKSSTTSYEDATAFLTGKYATDTQYNQKLNGLIETYNLTQYDRESGDVTVGNNTISGSGYMVPVGNYTLSSGFGSRGGEFHRGLDLAAASGEAVSAAKGGKVIIAEAHPSWGNYVVILHEDGSTTLYAHLSAFQTSVNQEVSQGQVIGLVGSTGNSTGPHLHFEICSDASLLQSKLIDPAPILFG
ncbi:glucosaminidase domain-containing protein [Enterococcus alishanensis]